MKGTLHDLVYRLARSRRAGIVAIVAAIFVVSLAAYAGPPAVSVDPTGDDYKTGAVVLSDDIDKGDGGFLGQVLVFLQPGTDPVAFGNANGLTYLDTLQSDKDAHIFSAGSESATTLALVTLSALPAVREVYENRRTNNVLYGFVPNDPYFHKNTPAAGWPGQWHLENEIVAGRDVNVMPAWAKWMTGSGVIMAVVDDSLQRTHPDLAPNYQAAHSWDFGQSDADPSPVWNDDRHGVSTSGVAAARGGNGIGVTGAAPYAGIAGLRIDFPNQTDAMFVDATLYHSSGANTSIKIKNHSYGISANYISAAAQNTALGTSTGAGTIHVWSAGNDRGTIAQDSNKKMTQASPNSITVAALGSDGIYSSYSCFGANVFCTAPSNSSGLYGITTTDRTGTLGYNGTDTFPDVNYTSVFGGTSSSAPLVAGVLALGKQVQPIMEKRFAKHMLARTCTVVNSTDATATSDGGWDTNGAGYHFNQNYGFGLVNADAFCLMARRYRGVTGLSIYSTPTVTVSAAIPDSSSTGVTRQFSHTPTTPLEEVVIYINATHTYRGDLEAYLTSPAGTTSRLMYRSGTDSANNIVWNFTSNAFWGENPSGTWTLKLMDIASGDTGTWNSYKASLYTGYPIYDTVRPTVTINQLSTQPDPTTANYVYFRVDFSEWVTDFTASDVALSGTANPTTAIITGGAGRSYTVRVTGMKPHGTVIATIPANAAHDANGYGNYASTSTDNVVTYNVSPKNSYVTPSSGSLAGGWKTLTTVHYDYNGTADIYKTYLLLNTALNGANAAYMFYDKSLNKVYLMNDAGTSWGTGYTLGSAVTLQNSQCYLSVANTTIATSGDYLLVKWRIYLKSPFSGSNLYGYAWVYDKGLRYDGWDQLGKYF